MNEVLRKRARTEMIFRILAIGTILLFLNNCGPFLSTFRSAAGFVQDRTFTVIHSQPRPSAFGQFAELMRIPEGETPAVQAREIAQLAVQLGVINQDFYVRLADFLDGVPQTRIEEIPADLNVDKNAQNNESIENASGELSDESDALSETNEEQELGTMVYNNPPPPIYSQNSDAKSTISNSSITRREIPSEDSEAAVGYLDFDDYFTRLFRDFWLKS